MRNNLGLGLVAATLSLTAPAHSAGKYDGWNGQDCVNMGKGCIANCDKYGVPETKASCMFNCTSTAMQCIDIVKGETAEISPGEAGPRATVRAPLSRPLIAPAR
jgi:hypothetical protein